MTGPTDLEFLVRVVLATGCGALIGLERQYRSRTAGLRTQALVAAGAAAFVLVGEQAATATTTAAAPLQITAYVVSGVVLAIHLLLRPVGRLVDRAPAGGADTPTRCSGRCSPPSWTHRWRPCAG